MSKINPAGNNSLRKVDQNAVESGASQKNQSTGQMGGRVVKAHEKGLHGLPTLGGGGADGITLSALTDRKVSRPGKFKVALKRFKAALTHFVKTRSTSAKAGLKKAFINLKTSASKEEKKDLKAFRVVLKFPFYKRLTLPRVWSLI